ncbi:MAG: hypothetical protein NC204_07780 [Candidatus Amulumruptor caecigallinarius]|nr:hypothetical protein [Candidatus Amulumruptor caecigallinarius]
MNFQEYICRLGGPELDATAFLKAMCMPPETSVKINRRKYHPPGGIESSMPEIGYEGLQQVSWCDSGFYLSERPKFTLNPLMHAGVFYVQDASSMIYETIVKKLIRDYDLPEKPAIADLCAAPGGKTTSMINAVPDGSPVVANEFVAQRARILSENLIKWGYPDIMVCNSPTDRFRNLAGCFHIVAVDAPCSGEGMMRKDEEARNQWSEGLVMKCAAMQREILSDAAEALAPGGFLIFSTCTFNTIENEDNVIFLTEELGLQPVNMDFPADWKIGRQLGSPYPALRFMPHLTRGEGLFVAVMRKPGSSGPVRHDKLAQNLRKHVKVVLNGIPRTIMKGRVEAPTTEWSLSVDFPSDKFPEVEVSKSTALSYLRHEAITLPPETEKGYVALTFKGYRIGMTKNIGTRANNLYPAEWRIRNL